MYICQFDDKDPHVASFLWMRRREAHQDDRE